MPLTTDTLDVLARKRSGVGPVPSLQSGAAYTADTGDATDGDAVDVSEALVALISVETDSALDIEIFGQRLTSPTPDTFELINGGELRSIDANGWTENVDVSTLGLLFVRGSGFGGAQFTITISPCLG